MKFPLNFYELLSIQRLNGYTLVKA